MIEAYNSIHRTKNYDEKKWNQISDTIIKTKYNFGIFNVSLLEKHHGCLIATLSLNSIFNHLYGLLNLKKNKEDITEHYLDKNVKCNKNIILNTVFYKQNCVEIGCYDENHNLLYTNKQRCKNNAQTKTATEKYFNYLTKQLFMNDGLVYANSNCFIFDKIYGIKLLNAVIIQNGLDNFSLIDSHLKTNDNEYACQIYENKRQKEKLFKNGIIDTFDRSARYGYFYDHNTLERMYFIIFLSQKNQNSVINYGNYIKNTTDICKSSDKATFFEILPDEIIQSEPDFLQTKKKALNNDEYLNDSKCIHHINNDKLCLDDPGVTKIIKNGKDMRKIEKKVDDDNTLLLNQRLVDERRREFNEVETMVDNGSVDFRDDFKTRCKRRKNNRSGKSVGISATRVVIVFAILIHHTDAIEGILGRLLREALGWGACPGIPRRPCTLSLSCWARGGITIPADTCGPSWLLTCCGPTPEGGLLNQLDEGYREDFTVNSPPQIALFKTDPLDSSGGTWRRTPQIANNVFRRRIDDDYDDESDCGVAGGSDRVLQKRIIGGRAAQLAEFPWQAHIRIGDYQCGGVLVSRWFVATAAHCVQRAHFRDIAVWLGALDTRAQAPPAEKHRVVQKIIHPLFRYRVTQPDRYDLALLMLSRPAILGFNVLPVCLPSSTWATPDRRYRLNQEDTSNHWSPDESLAGRKALVAGWGSTGNGGAPRGTHRLRSAVVPILSTEECIVWHKSKQISVEIHSEMICAGHSDGHQDACLGDSGGPLVVPKDGRYYLVGITSAGFGCGVDHQPGIYHNVLVTSHWIRHMIRR